MVRTGARYEYDDDEMRGGYFDQQHTVGTDEKFAPNARAVCLVAENSRYTDVAQAVFRMRGVNFGQTCDFIVVLKPSNKTKPNVWTLINENEDKYKDQMLGVEQYGAQLGKTLYRADVSPAFRPRSLSASRCSAPPSSRSVRRRMPCRARCSVSRRSATRPAASAARW